MNKAWNLLCLFSLALLAAPALALESSEEVGADQPLYCSAYMYRILPGDFNFCVARKLWFKGKTDQSIEYLELASGWGSKAAQQALGVAYFNGDRISKDRALGLAWLKLSAERGDATANALYASASNSASNEEREVAFRYFDDLRGRYSDEIAARRADQRYRRELYALEHEMAGGSVYGRGACIEGMAQLANLRASLMGFEDVVNPTNTCTMASEQHMLAELERRYEVYFSGWKGTVTTGDAESARVPPSL